MRAIVEPARAIGHLLLVPLLACGDNLHVHPPACAANPFDPLRYETLLSNGPGLTEADARHACQLRGEDLAIFSDQQELDAAAPMSITPAWIDGRLDVGIDAWLAASGCAAYLPWEIGFPLPPVRDRESCTVLDGAHRLANTSCADLAYDGQPLTAFCEVPYTGTCEAAGALTFTVQTDRIGNGRAACAAAGGHLLRIDSTAELAAASQLAMASGVLTFWLDATFADNAWSSPEGCPSILPWAGGQPDLTEPPRCVIYDLTINGAQTVRCDSVATAVICEAN